MKEQLSLYSNEKQAYNNSKNESNCCVSLPFSVAIILLAVITSTVIVLFICYVNNDKKNHHLHTLNNTGSCKNNDMVDLPSIIINNSIDFNLYDDKNDNSVLKHPPQQHVTPKKYFVKSNAKGKSTNSNNVISVNDAVLMARADIMKRIEKRTTELLRK